MTKFPQQSSGAGFTLAELLIAIAILMLLLLVALINWKNQINKGFDARRKADLFQIKTAFESYYTDHDCYPTKNILKNSFNFLSRYNFTACFHSFPSYQINNEF